MKRVVYHPAAETEVIESAQFYERCVPKLGTEFLDAVDQAVDAILKNPERCRVIESDVRRYLMPRFPFAIYYRSVPNRLRILALKHHSRHAGYGRGRR